MYSCDTSTRDRVRVTCSPSLEGQITLHERPALRLGTWAALEFNTKSHQEHDHPYAWRLLDYITDFWVVARRESPWREWARSHASFRVPLLGSVCVRLFLQELYVSSKCIALSSEPSLVEHNAQQFSTLWCRDLARGLRYQTTWRPDKSEWIMTFFQNQGLMDMLHDMLSKVFGNICC